MCIRDRFITSYVNLFRIYIAPHCLLDILWKIHNNRPWFTSPGDEKGFSDDTPKILSVPDRDGMLANTPGDPYNIDFLKRVISYKVRGHLSSEA